MNRRQFLLASASVATVGCTGQPIPFGGSPQAPNTDAARIAEDLRSRELNPRVRSRDWVSPDAERTVPARAVDFASEVPELAARARTAVLLHPRYSDEPAADASKLGGKFLWPAAQDWPVCRDHPQLRLVPLLQLRAEDFEEIEYRPGTDLLQVLWCPREHERCWARPVLFWRRRSAIDAPLAEMPADETAYPRYVPFPCRLFPERVTDLPDWDQLGPVAGELEKWNGRVQKFAAMNMEETYRETAPYRGWKLGGHANWIQGPEVPRCRAGHAMELFLSCSSESMHVAQAPVQEQHLYQDPARRDVAAAENAANAARIQFIGEGIQFTFICRRCPDWPVESISQC